MKTVSYQYKKSHYIARSVWRPSYNRNHLYREIWSRYINRDLALSLIIEHSSFYIRDDAYCFQVVRHNYITARYSPRPSDCPPLQWRHNGHDSVSNNQPHDCLLNNLFRRRPKKTSTLCVAGLCVGNSPGTGEFPAHKWPVTRKMFPFDDVIMTNRLSVSVHYKVQCIENILLWFGT